MTIRDIRLRAGVLLVAVLLLAGCDGGQVDQDTVPPVTGGLTTTTAGLTTTTTGG